MGGDGTRQAFDALFSAYVVVTTAALLVIGLALYFVYAPSSEAPAPPVHEDR